MKKIICFLLTLTLIICGGATTAYASGNVLNIDKKNISHEVSSDLYGLFIEDISYACDGGLVSQMVNNGSFEYSSKPESGWSFDNISAVISTGDGMNEKNPTYESLTVDGTGTIRNAGFTELYKYKTDEYDSKSAATPDMGFKANTEYDFSCYIKNIDFDGTVSIYLDSKSNKNNSVELNTSNISTKAWTKVNTKIKSAKTEDGGLAIVFNGKGSLQFDFASLVPCDSYGYGNSQWKYTTLRSDLVTALKNLKPSFIRFPGGCLAEGNDLEHLYNWKDTVGALEERKQCANVWANDDNGNYYNNTSAMGYHEYFQLCEDLGAKAIPIVNVGLTCQGRNGYDDHVDALKKASMSDSEWKSYLINEKGYDEKDTDKIAERTKYIDSLKIKSEADFEHYLDTVALRPGTDEFENYTQDVLDLIEYANGDSKTTYWGAIRAANGHEAPFNIKYIGLGNENWGDVYFRNFDALKKAVNEKYPDITVVSSSGPSADGEYFNSAWETINSKYSDNVVDEHYYTYDSYMMNHNDRYDSYDRDGAKVFVGEYASVSPGFGTMITKNNIYSAAEEAGYMTGFERNSDIVKMASYAPTFAKINSNSWNVNMIWFDSQNVVYTPNYYTQMLFSNNLGTKYIDTKSVADGIYQSVTVDEDAQVLYIKLVNTNSSGKKVTVNINGFDNINLVSNQSISNKYKSAANELNKQTVAPTEATIESNKNGFTSSLGAYSVNVIRVAYGENKGTGLYKLPDNIDLKTKSYMPASAKIGIVVFALIFIIATGAGYMVYTRIINKNAKPKKSNKNKKRRK